MLCNTSNSNSLGENKLSLTHALVPQHYIIFVGHSTPFNTYVSVGTLYDTLKALGRHANGILKALADDLAHLSATTLSSFQVGDR